MGVNKFQTDEEETIPILKIDPKIEKSQVERLRAVREKRNAKKAESTLANLEAGAKTEANLLPMILECVENQVTVGEISHRLRRVWGEYQEAVTI